MTTASQDVLTLAEIRRRARQLARAEPGFARVLARHGPPPAWARRPGFATLVHLILEQQVSLASARAAMERLVAATGSLTPASLLALDDQAMHAIGFSRQKRGYARGLARSVLDGQLDLDAVAALPDAEARARLTEVVGIGPWTADIYLLMALLRPDVWPTGDRALVVGVRWLRGLDHDPSPARMREVADAWRPWRSVAARLVWHAYLSEIRPPRAAERGVPRQR